MIKLTDKLWIGNSKDERQAPDIQVVRSILNVAQDLRATWGWDDGVEYMQVGLVDGPGNTIAAYHAAILALVALTKRNRTLVCCHTGSRALAVVVMYLNLVGGLGWDRRLELLQESVDEELPVPHQAHKLAFDKINWRLLGSVIGD